MEDDLITLAELARRKRISPQRVRQLAATDPAFPERRRVGRYWLVSAAAGMAYFANRQPRKGRPPHRSTSP
jgi:hypothetical protein